LTEEGQEEVSDSFFNEESISSFDEEVNTQNLNNAVDEDFHED